MTTMRYLRRAAVLAVAATALAGCDRRIIRKEERPFMSYAEQNWKRLSPTQKADYYEMIEKQRERAQKERAQDAQRQEIK